MASLSLFHLDCSTLGDPFCSNSLRKQNFLVNLRVIHLVLITMWQVWMAEQKLLAAQQKEKELELQYNKEQERFKNRYNR